MASFYGWCFCRFVCLTDVSTIQLGGGLPPGDCSFGGWQSLAVDCCQRGAIRGGSVVRIGPRYQSTSAASGHELGRPTWIKVLTDLTGGIGRVVHREGARFRITKSAAHSMAMICSRPLARALRNKDCHPADRFDFVQHQCCFRTSLGL